MMQVVQKIAKVYDVDHLDEYDNQTKFIVKTLFDGGVKEAALVTGIEDLRRVWGSLDGTIAVYVIVDKELEDCEDSVPGRLYTHATDGQWVNVLAGTTEDHGIVLVDHSRVKWSSVSHLAKLKDSPFLFVVE